MSKIDGHSVLLALDGAVIAASTGCRITENAEALGVAGVDDGTAEYSVAGLRGATITGQGFRTIFGGQAIAEHLIAGDELDASITFGNRLRYGKVYVTKYECTGDVGNKATYDFELTVSGPLLDVAPADYASPTLPENTMRYYLDGHLMSLAVNDTRVALSKSNTLTITRELRELQGVNNWRKYTPARYTWETSMRGLLRDELTAGYDIMDIGVGTEASVQIKIGLDRYEGTAIVTSRNLNGSLKQKADAQIELSGVGQLSIVERETEYFDLSYPVTL